MKTVVSKDGATIAFDRRGDGPPIILVGGASVDRTASAPLAQLMSSDFTVFNFDRRGRGDSGDTETYAVEREIEDIGAMLEEAGGTAGVFGGSSGAVLALRAAASALPISKLALWEPPFILDPSNRPPADQVEQLERMVAEGRRGVAAEYFLRKIVGLPPEFVENARSQPWWPAQEALAHTLAYDARILGDYSIPRDLAASVKTTTLVMAGGADFPWMRETARSLADALPNGRSHMLDGQGHNVDDTVLAPVLREFFGS